MSLGSDFKNFIAKGNVIDLAVAVVIGAAFGKIVNALVEDLVMPLVGAVLPGGKWREFTVTPLEFKIGHLLGSIVDFMVIAGVVFIVMVKLLGAAKKKLVADEPAAPPPPATKTCGECLESIPAAAKRCRACASVVAALVLLLGVAPAMAQAPKDPKFEYGKLEEVPAVEWKAQARGGLVNTTGNARTFTTTVGASASRRAGGNKLAFDAGLMFSKAKSLTFSDTNMDMLADDAEISRVSKTTSDSWNVKGRYDRFFTANNSLYASAQVLRDRPAGKDLVGGGQLGYSRQLVKNERHVLLAETGYDFSFEDYVASDTGVQIHSGRVFVGETLTLTKDTGAVANVEVLVNLNEEKEPAPGYGPTAAGKDTRVIGKLGFSTTLLSNVSFGFNFGLRYDNAPAPLAPAAVGATGFAPGFLPSVDKLDTVTEANLIVTLL